MNRDTWMQILQVAVIAPYLYQRSEKEKNMYFKIGLKLVVGAIVVGNLPPLIQAAQPLVAAAAKLQADANAQIVAAKEKAIDGEFTETKA